MNKKNRQFKKIKDREKQSKERVLKKRLLIREKNALEKEIELLKLSMREKLEPIRNEKDDSKSKLPD